MIANNNNRQKSSNIKIVIIIIIEMTVKIKIIPSHAIKDAIQYENCSFVPVTQI